MRAFLNKMPKILANVRSPRQIPVTIESTDRILSSDDNPKWSPMNKIEETVMNILKYLPLTCSLIEKIKVCLGFVMYT